MRRLLYLLACSEDFRILYNAIVIVICTIFMCEISLEYILLYKFACHGCTKIANLLIRI